jgi:hypothetical protein
MYPGKYVHCIMMLLFRRQVSLSLMNCRNSVLLGIAAFTTFATAAGFTYTGASYAGTAILNLSPTIAVDCAFNASSYTNSAGVVNSSSGYPTNILWEGTVGITCNHGGNIQISSSSPSVSSAVSNARNLPAYLGEYFRVGDTNVWKNGAYTANPSATLTPSPNIPYKIALDTNPSTTGPGLANGLYSYSFTLTATPN